MYKGLKVKGEYVAHGSNKDGYQVSFHNSVTDSLLLVDDGFNYMSEAQEKADELNQGEGE